MDENAAKLLEMVRRLAYREGDFTLASGRKSSYYIDMKEVTLDGHGSLLVGKAIYPIALQWDADAVGGMELGSVPISTAVCLVGALEARNLANVIVRKEAKGHGTKKMVEGKITKNTRALVVEDVVSTGYSSLKAVEALRQAGATVAGVVTVVDRLMGGAELFAKENIPFKSILTIDQIKSGKL